MQPSQNDIGFMPPERRRDPLRLAVVVTAYLGGISLLLVWLAALAVALRGNGIL